MGFATVLESIRQRADQLKEIQELYLNRPIPVHLYAQRFGKNAYTAMIHLIASFAMLAVVLSGVGVYGVFTYSVSQRTQEMGIRLALGASRGQLLRLVVSQALHLILVGGFAGIAAAWILSRLLTSMLVGVKPHDPMCFASAWILMTFIALLGSTFPARSAARTDLISVLHSE